MRYNYSNGFLIHAYAKVLCLLIVDVHLILIFSIFQTVLTAAKVMSFA